MLYSFILVHFLLLFLNKVKGQDIDF